MLQLARSGERLSVSYTGLEDPAVRAGCEEGWVRLTEVKCCRLETRALSWQVDTSQLTLDQTEFVIKDNTR